MTPDIPHGTYAGYQRHRLYGIPVCDECMTAQRAYKRDWRARTREASRATARALTRKGQQP